MARSLSLPNDSTVQSRRRRACRRGRRRRAPPCRDLLLDQRMSAASSPGALHRDPDRDRVAGRRSQHSSAPVRSAEPRRGTSRLAPRFSPAPPARGSRTTSAMNRPSLDPLVVRSRRSLGGCARGRASGPHALSRSVKRGDTPVGSTGDARRRKSESPNQRTFLRLRPVSLDARCGVSTERVMSWPRAARARILVLAAPIGVFVASALVFLPNSERLATPGPWSTRRCGCFEILMRSMLMFLCVFVAQCVSVTVT